MLSHAQIWSAVDALAARSGMTASALAKKAGLDATTFNRSKRAMPDGRLRWPSTESIAKILQATNTSLDEFLSDVVRAGNGNMRPLPLIGFAQAGAGGFFDDGGFPAGSGWDEVAFPNVANEHSYSLEISGDSMLPLYRDGDRIIVSPGAPIRRGDRVVVKTTEGEVLAKELKRQTARTIELKSLNPAHEDRVLNTEQVAWIARILWASQ
ncbi:MAG: helix-turn-helix transcriptional regulator [Hyphomicrobiales bacterium]|nr:helix-turn-helix transcriptional regulator [Hyphomicrobiales bacterium]MDE2113693.1 helix-turn-helix transcriptional regulator [Hyphomicrobiales bacterium]